MSFFKKRSEKKNDDTPQPPAEPGIRDEKIPNSLSLGWFWSENKNEFQMAKIPDKDRGTHFYVIGATGSGKTKFIEFLIQQDIDKQNGFGVIDPHGDLIEDIKGFLAFQHSFIDGKKDFLDRIILIDPTDPDYTVTFNPLEEMPGTSIPEQVKELVSSFRKTWSESWGVRMEDLMRNSLIALGEAGFALTELPMFLSQRSFREQVLQKVSHPIAVEYFKRFDVMTDRTQIGWIEPIMNKINAFFSDERIRQMFCATRSSFNLREAMDSRKIVLIKLDKGKLKDSADLLGSLLMAKIQMAAFSRSDIPQNKRVPFYLYVDEFQNFASESFSVILSEARKYSLSLIMAHQTLAQINPELRSLILGNTGIQAYFRINRHDSELLAKEGFEYSGYEIKTGGGAHPNFWSYAEEWEHNIGQLQSLYPRFCFIKHKIQGGMIPIQTVDIEKPWMMIGIKESEYSAYLKRLSIGKKYLVSRKELMALEVERKNNIQSKEEKREHAQNTNEVTSKVKPEVKKTQETDFRLDGYNLSAQELGYLKFISDHQGMFVTEVYKNLNLSGYKGDRLKEILIEKGLIVQEETRDGKGGRLAKVLNITEKGTRFIESSPLAGKGGDYHKYLQSAVKEQAEAFGWKAKIEEKIKGSIETVDVGLTKNDIKIAVEISSTTKPEQEIQNIRKCLEAGYDYIFCIAENEEKLAKIKSSSRKHFNARERERIRFVLPSRFKNLLSSAGSLGINPETKIVSEKIPKQKQLMGTEEAADFLGISRNTLYEWVIQRKVPFIKVGRLTKFKKETLEEWLERKSVDEDKKDYRN